MRKIEAHDLELFTINTGAFYEIHKLMASHNLGLQAWVDHVRDRSVSLYSREIEPVHADYDTVRAVAQNLKAYYERHIREMAQAVQP